MRVSQRGIIIQIKAGECCCPCLECLADETKQKSFMEVWDLKIKLKNIQCFCNSTFAKIKEQASWVKEKGIQKIKI